MSMLKLFFEIGTDATLFDGLEISKETELCDRYMGKCDILIEIEREDIGIVIEVKYAERAKVYGGVGGGV